MDVILIEDYKLDNIPENSVILDVIQDGRFYIGMWCKGNGSYKVAVPVSLCQEIIVPRLSFSLEKFLESYTSDAFADMDKISKRMDEGE